MKRNFGLAVIFSIFVLALSAAAQDKAANYSGTWILDLSRSKLGERSMIESETLTVTQTATTITVATTTKRLPPPADAPQGNRMGGRMGGSDMTMTYSLDGKETKTEIEGRMGKMPVTLKAKSDGSKLQLSSSSTFTGPNGEMTMTNKEKWQLSADGKTLTIDAERTTPRGMESTTKVFAKTQ